MFSLEWIRNRLVKRPQQARRDRRRSFNQRMQATLAVKPLESRLVLSGTPFSTDVMLVDDPLDSSIKNLVITDTASTGMGHNENITLRTTATTLTITDNGTDFAIDGVIPGSTVAANLHTVTIPLSQITGKIIVNSLGGNDTLTVDYTGGFRREVEFDGGDPITGPGDSLIMSGAGTFASVIHTFESESSGSIQVAGSQLVSYVGLEPITDNLTATDRVFDFQGGDESVVLNRATTAGFSFVDSNLSEAVTFRNPTATLTLLGGAGNDSFDVVQLGSGFAADLTIDGGDGTDSIFITPTSTGIPTDNTAIALSATASDVFLSAETVEFNKAFTARAVTVTANSLEIAATLTANTGGITLRPKDANTSIGLGTGAGTLQLSEVELQNLASTTLVTIGQVGNTGAIDIGTADLSGEAFNLTIIGGATTFSGGLTLPNNKKLLLEVDSISSTTADPITDVTIGGTTGTLSILSTGAIGSLANPLKISVPRVDADTSANDSSQFWQIVGSATISTAANAPQGITAGNGTVVLLGGTLNLGAANRIADTTAVEIRGNSTFNQAGSAETIRQLTLVEGSVVGTGTLTTLQTIQVQSGLVTSVLSGTVDLQKTTTGTFTLSRAATYTGDTIVSEGTFVAGIANVIPDGVGRGNVILGDNGTLELTGSETINGLLDFAAMGTSLGTAQIIKSGAAATTLTIGNNNADSYYSGSIAGVMAVTKTGTGTITLNGTNTHTGLTTISNGTLSGNGSISGAVTISAAGRLDPGDGIGQFTAGRVNFATNSRFAPIINGETTAGTDYDQLIVTDSAAGSVTLTNSILDLSGSIATVGQESIRLIDNQGTSAVVGTFKTPTGTVLTEGAEVTVNGQTFNISYVGGDGNDVVLQAETYVTLVGNDLVIRDINNVSNDRLTITVGTLAGEDGYIIADPGRILTTDIVGASGNGSHTIFVAADLLMTGAEIHFETLGGDDHLTVDFVGGDFANKIVFDGGLPNTGTADRLILENRSGTANIVHTATGAGSGNINIGSGLTEIEYLQLESIFDDLSATDRQFNFQGGSETIAIDLGSTIGSTLANAISSDLGTAIAFANPSDSLAIDAGSDTDTVNLIRLGSGFAAALNIDGGLGSNDTINIFTPPTTAISAPSSDMLFVAENVNFNKALTANTVEVRSDTIQISATLTANGGISLLPTDPASFIGLGNGSGTFQLSQSELSNLASSGTVVIGQANGTGTIDVNGVALTGELFDLTLRGGATIFNGSLSLRSGKTLLLEVGSITSPNAGTDVSISGGTLLVHSTGTVGSTSDPLTVAVGSLEVNTAATNGAQALLSTGTVTLLNPGLNAGNGAITLLGGTFNLGSNEQIADSSQLVVSGTTLGLGTFTETVAALRLISGSITGTGSSGTLISLSDFELESGTITAVLAGAVGLNKSTPGIVLLSQAATYAGDTRIDHGTLRLGADNVIPNGTGVGNVILNSPGVLDLGTFAEIINGLSGSGTVTHSGAIDTFTLGDNNAAGDFSGSINGTLNVVKIGSGTQTLGGSNGFTGTLTINDGTVLLNGSKTGTGKTTVNSGGTLGGTGMLAGDTDIAAGGTLAPGVAIGQLTTRNVEFVSGANFNVNIDGEALPGMDYDQLDVIGAVRLNNATLNLSGSIPTVGAQQIVLINNDGTDAVTGIFNNLAEGAIVTVNNLAYRISYVGGTGNDVVLFADTFITLVGNDLVISDINSTSDDKLTIIADDANSRYVISDPNLIVATDVPGATRPDANTVYIPYAAFTGEIQFKTLAGSDSLEVDFSGSSFANSIMFDGGSPGTGMGDRLHVKGSTAGSFAEVTHTFTASTDDTIDVTGNAQIRYSNLERIDDSLQAQQRFFNFDGLNETITVDLGTVIDSPASNLDNLIQGSQSTTVAFINPMDTLTVNAGGGNDTIHLLNLGAGFTADVFINGNAGNDIIDVTAVNAGSYVLHGNAGDDDVTIRTVGAAVPVSAFGDGENNSLTVITQDQVTADPRFEFAGFVFDQDYTPDLATAVPLGVLPGGDGVVITAGIGGAPGPVNFPLSSTTGFNDSLTIGRLLGATTGARAINLPNGNNGTILRAAVELEWSGGRTLTNLAGDDFVVYSSSSSPAGPDAFMVQVHVKDGTPEGYWTRWRYELADSRENYPGQGVSGAFAFAFDLTNFEVDPGMEVDRIRIASMTAADRIDIPAGNLIDTLETGVATGQFRGHGYVIPDDGGVTSNVHPDPGPSASFDFFGNATFDPDPLYVGVLNQTPATTNFRNDVVEVTGSEVRVTTQGVAQPEIQYELFETLTVSTQGGSDEVKVYLANDLPTTINVNGGDPTTTDKVTIFGVDGGVEDNLRLADRQIQVLQGPNSTTVRGVVNLAGVEQLVIDVSGDPRVDALIPFVDQVTIERTFTLSGNNSSIHIDGDALDDQLTVNTEPPPPLVVPDDMNDPAETIGTGTFFQTSTPDVFTHLTSGPILVGGNGAIANQPAFDTGSSNFPNTINGNLSIGQLATGGTGNSRFLNMPAGDNGVATRSVFELTWSGARTLTDGVGDDIVIYESGSAGAPEPFMIQVHRTDTDVNSGWSEWYYFAANIADYDAATSSFVTKFDLAQMGLGGVTIDAIRVANIIDADRMADPMNRPGVVIPNSGDNGLTRPLDSNGNTFGNSSLDPDIIYVGVTQRLNLPPDSGAVDDIVVIKDSSVNVAGFIPITYQGLDQLTVNTGDGSDRIQVAPSLDTQINIQAENPAFPRYAGDRLEFELEGTPTADRNPTLTITDPGAGVLETENHRDVVITGIETFGLVPDPGSGTKFDVVIDANSSSLGNLVGDGVADNFRVFRNDRGPEFNPNFGPATEVEVNGQLVFRSDRSAMNQLQIMGSGDDDSLSVDFVGGNPIPTGGIDFVGLGGSNKLEVVEGTAKTATHNFTDLTIGNLQIVEMIPDGLGSPTTTTDITYQDVNQPILEDLLVDQRVLNFNNGPNDLRIVDAGVSNDDQTRIINGDTASFPELIFRNPQMQLIVNLGGGGDTLQLEAVDDGYQAQTILNGDSGNDTIYLGSEGKAGNGTIDFITFQVEVHAGGDAGDKLVVDDERDMSGDNLTITETTIGRALGDNFFGIGGGLIYDGIAELEITTSSADDVVNIQDDLTVNLTNNPLANAKSKFELQTGTGNDTVTIQSIDAGYKAATTILTGRNGADSITQLVDLNLGSPATPTGYFSTGNLSFEANAINLGANLDSTGGTASYDGAITLSSNVSIDTDQTLAGTQGGAIVFSGNTSIDSAANQGFDLTIDAGTASIRFNNNLGFATHGELGRFEIEQANGGVLFGRAESDIDPLLTPVNNIRTLGPIDIGSKEIIAGGIVFNGGTSNLSIATAGQSVRMNGAVTLVTDVEIETTYNSAVGADITFTNHSPIDSGLAAATNLTLNAGGGRVTFNENIGEFHALRSLVILQADNGVVFGIGIVDTITSGGNGPVNIVRTTSGVDIGKNAFIGGPGIVLNGGNGLLTISSTGAQLRFNGEMKLNSNVRIDSGTGMGNIIFTNDTSIDSQTGTPRDLTLQADGGAIRFNGDIGGQNMLGAFTIERANLVVFGPGSTDGMGSVTTNPVNTVRTNGPIIIGSAVPVMGGIEFNGGSSLLTISTQAALVQLNGPTRLASDVMIDTDPTLTHVGGGEITFTAVSTVNAVAGNVVNLTLDAGVQDVLFAALVGNINSLQNITVQAAGNLNFAQAIHTTGDVTQHAGSGTTSLHGTLGTGIGGELNLTTNAIHLTTGNVQTVGDVNLTAQNEISLTVGGGLDAGSSNIRLATNQDNGGTSSFIGDSSAVIRTTSDATDAVTVVVGGTGNAIIAEVHAGTTSGGITVIAGGAIVDNSASETPNFTAFHATLQAQIGIGGGSSPGDDINTQVAELSTPGSRGNINIREVDDLQLQGLLTSNGKVTITAGGAISIQDTTSVTSTTGRISNAPPPLRLREANPDDVLIPGDPTQEIVGTIGGVPGTGDNFELARNLTLTVTWADGVTNTVTGLNAGDTLTWTISPNGESLPIITRTGTGTGPINLFIQRTYPLQFLQGVTDTDVVAQFTVANDSNIVLNDAQPFSLNFTGPLAIATSISNLEFRPPPIIIVTDTITMVEQPKPNLLVDNVTVVDTRSTVYKTQELVIEERKEEVAQLYLVHVGPDGQEGIQVALPLSELQDLSRLLKRLEKAPIPNGLYRIYHQEPGLPARKILEFRKTGNSIGDPIREPGRGSNPLQDSDPTKLPEGTNKTDEEIPPSNAAAPLLDDPNQAAEKNAAADQVQPKLPSADQVSFTRAARWRRALTP